MRNSLAFRVEHAEIVLRAGLTLVRRATQPPRRLDIRLRQAAAIRIDHTDAVLRIAIPLLGQRNEYLERLRVVAACVGQVRFFDGRGESSRGKRRGEQRDGNQGKARDDAAVEESGRGAHPAIMHRAGGESHRRAVKPYAR